MIPKQIKNWKSNQYFYLDDIDKNLTYHLYLQYKGVTHEIFRETINGTKYYGWNVWGLFSNLAGWRVDKDHWFTEKEDMQRVEWDCFPDIQVTKHFYNKTKLKKYMPVLNYVYPENYYDNDYHADKENIWEFIKTLNKYPEMEMVYKNPNIRHLWHDTRLYKMKKDTKKAFYKYVQAYGETMWAYTFNEILWCSKQLYVNRTEKKYKEYLENNYYESSFKGISGSYFRKRYSKLIKNRGRAWVKQEYKDYLGACKKLGIKNRYPRDLEKAHDNVMNQLDMKDDKRIITKKNYKKISKCLPDNVILPQTQGELRILGRLMDNCVGTYDYGDRMKKGECLILSVNKDKNPIACCEIDTELKDWRINQLYGPHNSFLKDKEPRKLINLFIKKVKEMSI